MTALHWRDAEHRDRAALQRFICTPPVQPKQFGRGAPPREYEWELQAQGVVRALRPPARPGQLILVGEDDRGIGAAIHAIDDEGPGIVFISVMAVALRLRRDSQRSRIALEMLDEVIDRLANRADAADLSRLIIWGNVDPRNEACRRLCVRAGAETFDQNGRFDRWILPIHFQELG